MAVPSIAATGVQTAQDKADHRPARWLAACNEWLAAERAQVALWLPVCLGLGIALWFALPLREHWIAAMCAALAVAAAGLSLTGAAVRALAVAGLLCAAGTGIAWQRAESVAAPRLDREITARRLSGEVIEIEDIAARDRTRLLIRPADPDLPPLVRVSLRGAPPPDIAVGATVSLRATLRPPPGPSVPGGYDFARKAWFDGIGATGFALGDAVMTAPAPERSSIMAAVADLRARLTARMRTAVGGEEGGVAAALVTGDTGGIGEAVTQDWRDSGIAHLLSISGLHIAVVVGGMMWMVRAALCLVPWIALRWPVKTIAAAAAALAGIAYTLLAGAEVPTVRSCIATLLVLAGLVIGRRAISLRTVAFAAFAILLLRPEALVGPSFQLSFAAVTGIVAFYESRLGRFLLDRDPEAGIAVRFGKAALALLVSGLVVELLLSPVALAHFGRTGLYGVLANLFAIPFSSFVVMPALVVALLLDPLGLAAPAFALLSWSIGVLNTVAATTAAWPGAVAHAPAWPPAALGLMACGGLWLLLWRTRVRLLGLMPLVVGLLVAVSARPADLLVSEDGRHAGLLANDGTLALLRPQAGDFIVEMWSEASGARAAVAFDGISGTICTRDACRTRIDRGGRRWTILATRSPVWMRRATMEPDCAAADIVISDRRLPPWCVPRWLKLDRPTLERTGAVAIHLAPPQLDSVADRTGDHPWRPMFPAQ